MRSYMKQNSLRRCFFWINSSKIRRVKKLLLKSEKSKECNKASRLIKKLNFDCFKYNDFMIANELWKKYILQLIEPK